MSFVVVTTIGTDPDLAAFGLVPGRWRTGGNGGEHEGEQRSEAAIEMGV